MTKLDGSCKLPELRFPEFREAEGWDENTFGGAATFLNGRAYKQEELLDRGKYRVLRVGNFFSNNQWYFSNLDLEEDKYCTKGDLLYAWSASFGPRIWHGERTIYHYHIWKVLEKKGVDKSFLFILLGYETERMKAQSANGLGLMHITKGAIESWKCHIPEIREQQKIADCLSFLDELITAEAQQLATLKAHKKGLMQQLFPAEGETLPKLRFPEFRDAAGWEEKRLGNCLLIHPEYGVNAPAVPYSETLPTYLRITDISEDGVFNADQKVSVGININNENYLIDGDIVLARTGASVGKSYRYKIADGQLVFAGFLIRIRPDASKASSVFIHYSLTSDFYWKWIHITSARSGQPGINGNEYASFPVLLPKIEEQQKIADCLSSLDDLITAQTQKLATLKAHKKGLMQQLFPTADEVNA